jgi:hypothetical protein
VKNFQARSSNSCNGQSGEAGQPRDEQFTGEKWLYRDRQRTALLRFSVTGSDAVEFVDERVYVLVKGLASLGQMDRATAALEKFLTEFVLEVAYLVAYCGCRDEKLVGRIAEALVLGHDTKGSQASQRDVLVSGSHAEAK